jgi:hypothetical protein
MYELRNDKLMGQVTIDIHSQASDQSYIEQGVSFLWVLYAYIKGEILSRFSTSMKDSAGKLTRMISTNSPRRIPTMVGMFLVALLFIYWLWPSGRSSGM